jgi:glycosyltransferase involved in cell wall biosynthesis
MLYFNAIMIPSLTILLPCLNEAKTLPLCLMRAKTFVATYPGSCEILVADNGSTDGSQDIARSNGARVIDVMERGYGAALAAGITAAKGDWVVMGDADDSYHFDALHPFIEQLKAGADLVMGNRFKGGIEKKAMPFLNRWLGNPVLSFLGRIFFGIKIGDFHCGLRAFRRTAIIGLNLQTTGMEYASEMVVRAALHGLRIAEVPVRLYKDGRGRPPHLHPWRDGWRHLRFLLLYSPRWLYLYPSMAMILIGIIMAAMLLPGPVMIADGVGLDVHTLFVGAMAILIGLQGLTFGLLARYYAMMEGLYPTPEKARRFLAEVTLERILLAASILFIMGLAGIGLAAYLWSAVNFGALDYRDVMRVLIVAATFLVGGLQLGFSGFFFGVMQIKRKT